MPEPQTAIRTSLPKWPQVIEDYHGALVRLATMRTERKQYLIFGFVELFPRDIPLPDSFAVSRKPWSVPGFGGDITLAASATAMPVADALVWYEEAALGRLTIPLLSSGSGTAVEIASPPFGAEPSFGRFCVGEAVPFAQQWHDGPRIHRLVPMDDAYQAVQHLGKIIHAREWLASNTGFDPFQFEEWLGSITLLAPDPLLASVGAHREPSTDGSEKVILQAHQRRYDGYPEGDAKALKVVLLQRRPAGWTEVLATSFDDDGFLIMEFPEPLSETGYAISCPVRGLLRAAPPTSWIGEIKVGIGIVDAVLDVEVPTGGRRKPASQYRTNRLTDGGDVHVGERLPLSGAIRIVQLLEARKQRIQIESAPQHLFGASETDKDELTEDDLRQMRADAEAYLASLVAAAHRRVIFVDPDFGLRELQNYALRVMRDGVDVKILTGGRLMRDPTSPDDNTSETSEDTGSPDSLPAAHGTHLLAQLRHLQSILGRGVPEVFVMPGSNRPWFHDRFVVIDDAVWRAGRRSMNLASASD